MLLVPTPKVKVTIRSKVKLCLKLCCSETTEANLMKLHRKIKHNEKMCPAHDLANLMTLHRKIKHNEKVCRAHDLGSYAQGQGRSQVRGQNLVSTITQKLLKQI